MEKYKHDDLEISWYMWKKPDIACPISKFKQNFFVSEVPGYQNFTYFQRNSYLQSNVPLIHIQTSSQKFRGKVILNNKPNLESNWKFGWLQSIRESEHTGTYSGGQKLYMKIAPLPIRDVQDSSSWPFSDTPKQLTEVHSLYKVKSEDEPMHYFPITYPGTANSYLVCSSGKLNFLTALCCYRKLDNCLIALGAYKWTIDFGSSYHLNAQIKWKPNGMGLICNKITHPPAIVNIAGPKISTQLWGAEKLSLSKEDAFENMKESFNGKDWTRMTDHTDDEGPKGTSWAPLTI
ncbi:hypothetical protein [uncultured Paraglaciecola sp.]|uniref:hypothetical protein n=1 Tax=uncultured Paraglaciecola sp. TaxID=1765024 RepID=UPI0030DDD56A|tara:strand:+ start:2664 stop:3536 length:873 start_codon:yes stop_codon:yes gene_type:complete